MKILIFGGTGAMGVHLTSLLRETEHEVLVTTRRERKSTGNIAYIHGNAHDVVFVNKLILQNRWDVIVDFMIYNTDEFRQRIHSLLSNCWQYIYISSSRVYADTQPCINEESPRLLDVCDDDEYLLTDEYALTKARQEDLLRHSEYKNWTIIRPYITYSEERLQLGVLEKENWLYRALQGRTVVFSKDIASRITTLTYGYDVARGMLALFGKKEALCEAFHITVDECHTWNEIFEVYMSVLSKHLDNPPKIKFIDYNPRVKLPYSKAQVVYDRYYNRRFDNSKIKNFIDTSTFKPTLEGLVMCLEEFLRHPQFNIKGWSEQALYDRITNEWTPLKDIPSWKDRLKYLLRRTILHK